MRERWHILDEFSQKIVLTYGELLTWYIAATLKYWKLRNVDMTARKSLLCYFSLQNVLAASLINGSRLISSRPCIMPILPSKYSGQFRPGHEIPEFKNFSSAASSTQKVVSRSCSHTMVDFYRKNSGIGLGLLLSQTYRPSVGGLDS